MVSWLSHKTKVELGLHGIGGGYIKFAGFAVVHEKITRLLG
jgi:hypothetical protein